MEKLTFSLSDKELFIEGYKDASPSWYTGRDGLPIDMDSPYPWCCPWEYAKDDDWHTPGLSPYDMGRRFAEKFPPEDE